MAKQDAGIGTSELAAAVRQFALENGAAADHPQLAGRFARRVAALVIDGHVPAKRLDGRWYVRPETAPKVAQIMGLVPAEEDKAIRA